MSTSRILAFVAAALLLGGLPAAPGLVGAPAWQPSTQVHDGGDGSLGGPR